VNAAFAGQSTGLVFEGEKRFDMVVRLDTKDRKNVMILKIFCSTPFGNQIPLSQLAKVEVKMVPTRSREKMHKEELS
jgi:cobalt-zinc-cadmium resistance protein CzcA